MKTVKCYFFALFISLLFLTSLPAQVIVLSNLGELNGLSSSIGDATFPVGLTNLIIAQEFVTGSTAYTNEPITVTIDINSTGSANTFQVDIFNKSTGDPGNSILTLVGPGMPAPGNAVYTGSATLAANTSYYVVVSAPASSLYQINTPNTSNINNALGFTSPNEVRASSNAGPPVWGVPGAGRIKFALQIDNAVPVELIEFKGKLKGNNIVLDWKTASENNNDYFEIQHSRDGKKFEVIGIQDGVGTISTMTDYSYSHLNPGPGEHYYRLKQVDFDSRFEYSEIIFIKAQKEKQFTIYPVPTKGELTISNGQGNAKIYNNLGQNIMEFVIEEDRKTIQISYLPEGPYLLQIHKMSGEILSQKFIKE